MRTTSSSVLAVLVHCWAAAAGAQTLIVPGTGSAAVAPLLHDFDWSYSASVLDGSSITATYDAGAGTLTFDAIDIRLSAATRCVGVHFCTCFNRQRFRLATASRPVASIATGGRFATTFPAVYEGESGGAFPFCTSAPHEPVGVTWQIEGTVHPDAPAGNLLLQDAHVVVDGTGVIDAATLDLTFSTGLAGFRAHEGFRSYQSVGAPLVIEGLDITPGTIAKAYINTATGPRDVAPDGLRPTATTPTRWEGTLSWPWPLAAPDDVDLGHGFLSVHLVRTDRGYDRSNAIARVLTGNPSLGVPALTGIDLREALSPTSWDPRVAIANAERVVAPGGSTSAAGAFANPDASVLNVFGAAGNCAPPGGVVPSLITGQQGLIFTLPADCPVGPGAIQVVDTVTGRASNIVSLALGEAVDVSDVSVAGTQVTVTGTGFNRLSAVNFFAHDTSGTLTNFGGYDTAGRPRLDIVVADAHTLRFELPAGLGSGACFVEVLNPPHIDFTSSRSRLPGGACHLP